MKIIQNYDSTQIEPEMLVQGDCLEVMKGIASNSVDLVLADPPYNITRVKYDQDVIDLTLLWKEYQRIIKDTGTIVLFAAEPFTSKLIMSNLNLYKYKWIWKKNTVSNIFNSKKQPLRTFEEILIFYNKNPIYNPQMKPNPKHNPDKPRYNSYSPEGGGVYGARKGGLYINSGMNYPVDILEFSSAPQNKRLHKSQKPVNLLEYFIKTFTNEDKNTVVLDSFLGSGSTGIACQNLNRQFIGIELDPDYFKTAVIRMRQNAMRLKGI